MAVQTTEAKWHIIGRGLVGWHAEGVNVSSSGGDIEPRTWWADGHTIAPYQAAAIDGAPIYDASGADVDAFSRFVIAGPMVAPELTPDGWNKFGHDGAEPRALDRVGVQRFIALLRERVPGVRFGRVVEGAIVWDETE
jgi:hypothetical protein